MSTEPGQPLSFAMIAPHLTATGCWKIVFGDPGEIHLSVSNPPL
jgi:hypothetical protein